MRRPELDHAQMAAVDGLVLAAMRTGLARRADIVRHIAPKLALVGRSMRFGSEVRPLPHGDWSLCVRMSQMRLRCAGKIVSVVARGRHAAWALAQPAA